MTKKPLFMLFHGNFNDDFCLQKFYNNGHSPYYLDPEHVIDIVSGYYVVHIDSVLATLHSKSKSIEVENKVWNLQDGESCILYSTSRKSNMIAYRVSEQDIAFLHNVKAMA